MNFSGPIDTNNFFSGTAPIAPTDDGGYLVGGTFNSYQGFPRPSIAKIDSSGAVDPQYFSTGGPDSSIALGSGYPEIYFIHKSKFGGYYVGGDFLKWNGQPSQPLVRLTDLVTGVDEAPIAIGARGTSSEVSVYPNPSNGIISIESKLAIEHVEVLNLSGASTNFNLFVPQNLNAQPDKFYQNTNTFVTLSSDQRKDGRRVNKRMLNLTNLTPGVYFLKVTLTSGEVITKKLIKQ